MRMHFTRLEQDAALLYCVACLYVRVCVHACICAYVRTSVCV